MKTLKSFLSVSLVFISFLTFGWGRQGHIIIAETAKTQLDKKILDSVNKYFGTMSWADASVWMDEYRGTDRSMNQWHYINIEEGESYKKGINNGNNVVDQLEIAFNKLKDRHKLSADEIALNLRIIFHLIGDIHCPLHVGYGKDKGGNTISVTYEGKEKKFHSIWDGDIIYGNKIKQETIVNYVVKLPTADKKIASVISPVEWMNQTRNHLPVIYQFNQQTNVIDMKYINDNKAIAISQLANAAIRLQATLVQIFNLD